MKRNILTFQFEIILYSNISHINASKKASLQIFLRLIPRLFKNGIISVVTISKSTLKNSAVVLVLISVYELFKIISSATVLVTWFCIYYIH